MWHSVTASLTSNTTACLQSGGEDWLAHHPSLHSAIESELQFDESTIAQETEPYKSNVSHI